MWTYCLLIHLRNRVRRNCQRMMRSRMVLRNLGLQILDGWDIKAWDYCVSLFCLRIHELKVLAHHSLRGVWIVLRDWLTLPVKGILFNITSVSGQVRMRWSWEQVWLLFVELISNTLPKGRMNNVLSSKIIFRAPFRLNLVLLARNSCHSAPLLMLSNLIMIWHHA